MSSQLKSVLICVVLAAGCTLAENPSTQVTIKGHTLGETAEEYVQRAPGGGEVLQACRASTTPKLAKHLKTDYDWCRQLVAAIDEGGRVTVKLGNDRPVQAVPFLSHCSARAIDAIASCNSLRKAIILGGKLVEMQITTADDYADVLLDMKARLGDPTTVDDRVSQNGYGATFHNPTAIWIQPTVFASMFQRTEHSSSMGYFRMTDVTIRTADYEDSLVKERQTKQTDTLK
jgi:hypothetical protein